MCAYTNIFILLAIITTALVVKIKTRNNHMNCPPFPLTPRNSPVFPYDSHVFSLHSLYSPISYPEPSYGACFSSSMRRKKLEGSGYEIVYSPIRGSRMCTYYLRQVEIDADCTNGKDSRVRLRTSSRTIGES